MNAIPKSEKDISIFHLRNNWSPMPMHSGIRWKLPSSAILNSIWEACGFRDITPPTEVPRMTSCADSPWKASGAVTSRSPRCSRRYSPRSDEELAIIAEVGYEEYFLLTWEILEDCKAEGIEWITRGSAADSLVCYCLGISDVCPIRFELYFRRFLNRDRMVLNKLPDIDLDFARNALLNKSLKSDQVFCGEELSGEVHAIIAAIHT
jgi:hypothetical protein